VWTSFAGHRRELAQRLQLVCGPGPRLDAVDIQGPHRLASKADGDAQNAAHVELADYRVEPDPGRRGRQVLDDNRPVLGIGLKIRAFAEVVLDLDQQLHGGVGGSHPPGWAVGTDQGQPSPVDLQDGSGRLGHPEQPGQQVIGLGQGHPELLNGPGDHLTVNSHSVVPRGDGDNQGMLPPPGRIKQRDAAGFVAGHQGHPSSAGTPTR
jgi:hypothetical protein